MKTRSIIVAIIAVTTIVVIGCQKDPLFDTTFITTSESITSVTPTSAVIEVGINCYGPATIETYGFCWSISPNPTIKDNTKKIKNIWDESNFYFSLRRPLEGLSPNTTYYVRAFASNSLGTAYGEDISFSTLE